MLETAESGLEEAGMMHYLAAARRRRGEILGGAAGSALISAAESYYAQQGVKNPARMTDALAPGRWTNNPVHLRAP